MGQVVTAGGNGAIEPFFALRKKNALNSLRWATREVLRLVIVMRVERVSHRRRPQLVLGKLSPVGFGAIMTTQVALAAQ